MIIKIEIDTSGEAFADDPCEALAHVLYALAVDVGMERTLRRLHGEPIIADGSPCGSITVEDGNLTERK